jgi:hypothetical protein
MRLLNRGILLGLVSLLSFSVHGQDDLEDLFTKNLDDAEKLIGAYIAPGMNAVSVGISQGWFNTAKNHKIAGIDITVTANGVAIPTDELFYEPGKLGLTTVTLDPSSPDYPKAPTIFGPDETPKFRENSSGQTFDGPPGLDLKGNLHFNRIPVPMAHVGIGLPKNTDLKVRFTPDLQLGDESKIRVFGLGVMHDLKQWIPGIKLMPFDLSGFVGFTKLKFQTDFSGNFNGTNQRAAFEVNTTTIQGIISKKFSVLTVYGAVGYNIAKSNLSILGTYDLNSDGDTNDTREKDPLNMEFGASGPRITAGMMLKLAVITLHADYSLQKYSCLSVGFGISVR